MRTGKKGKESVGGTIDRSVGVSPHQHGFGQESSVIKAGRDL